MKMGLSGTWTAAGLLLSSVPLAVAAAETPMKVDQTLYEGRATLPDPGAADCPDVPTVSRSPKGRSLPAYQRRRDWPSTAGWF